MWYKMVAKDTMQLEFVQDLGTINVLFNHHLQSLEKLIAANKPLCHDYICIENAIDTIS